MPKSEASISMIEVLLKSGKARTGAEQRTFMSKSYMRSFRP